MTRTNSPLSRRSTSRTRLRFTTYRRCTRRNPALASSLSSLSRPHEAARSLSWSVDSHTSLPSDSARILPVASATVGIDARRSPLRAARRGCRPRPARSVPTRCTPRPCSRCGIPTRVAGVAGHLTLETAFGLLDSMDDTPGARLWVLRVCLHRPLGIIVTTFCDDFHIPTRLQAFSARSAKDSSDPDGDARGFRTQPPATLASGSATSSAALSTRRTFSPASLARSAPDHPRSARAANSRGYPDTSSRPSGMASAPM
jgi:hypothetical protein